MAKVIATRTAQFAQVAEFVFNFSDYATDSVDGVKKTFGSTTATADPAGAVAGLQAGTGITIDAIPMPPGAVIVGGSVVVETAYAGAGAGATLSVGIVGSPTALVNAMDLDAATAGSSTAMTLVPLLSNGGQNLRVTTAGLTATATAGKVRVRIQYTIDGRNHENVIV